MASGVFKMADVSTTTVITKTCKFFQREKCKFGSECQFLHPEKPLNLPGNNLTEVGKLHDVQKLLNPSNQEVSSSLRVEDLKPCRFFKSKRGCAYGNKCRFLHSDLKIFNETEGIGKVPEPYVTDQEEEVSHSNDQTEGEEKGTDNHKESSDRRRVVCKFFKKKKGCLRGNRCPFAHVTTSSDKTEMKPPAGKGSKKAGNLSNNKRPQLSEAASKPSISTKQFTGQPADSRSAQSDNQNEVIRNNKKAQIPSPPGKKSIAEDKGKVVNEQPPDECMRLRSIEIQQLKRRFKDNYYEITENSCYKIKFKPTDPDWAFKIEAVYLDVSFPEDYPLHIFAASLSKEQVLSQDIIKFVTQKIQQWAVKQEQASIDQGILKLYFRPFLHWFDRNLESFIVDAGRQVKGGFSSSSTIECEVADNPSQDNICILATASTPHSGFTLESVPVLEESNDNHPISGDRVHFNRTKSHEPSESLNMVEIEKDDIKQALLCHQIEAKKPSGHEGENCTIRPCDSNIGTGIILMVESKTVKATVDMDNKYLPASIEDINCGQGISNNETDHANQAGITDDIALAVRRGTEIQFRGLHLEENVSTLIGNRIVFTLECNRCRQRIDQQLSGSGSVCRQCTRCASVFAVTYRPVVIHQFSSILGYLDLDGCVPFDVVLAESELKIGCLHCSKETAVKGLQYGANWSWCRHCHLKLEFHIPSTRFHELQNDATQAASLKKTKDSSTSSKPKRPAQSSGIKEGQPLPGNGTCKHYKKSYRWLRFPCCGKCYPCDLCHEVQESHEMKYATRMVCGFCSKEQPYSQRPCNGCKSSVTKSRSSHWEGGKGCRDKLTMSRNDDQKYSQQGKTASRKAQRRSETKGKGKGSKGK